jgi:hypothetical protein
MSNSKENIVNKKSSSEKNRPQHIQKSPSHLKDELCAMTMSLFQNIKNKYGKGVDPPPPP